MKSYIQTSKCVLQFSNLLLRHWLLLACKVTLSFIHPYIISFTACDASEMKVRYSLEMLKL